MRAHRTLTASTRAVTTTRARVLLVIPAVSTDSGQGFPARTRAVFTTTRAFVLLGIPAVSTDPGHIPLAKMGPGTLDA